LVPFEVGTIEPVVIQGDDERLRRLLLNLIDNVIKYTPADGHVTLSLRRRGEWAALDVTNTGMGLSATEQATWQKKGWMLSIAIAITRSAAQEAPSFSRVAACTNRVRPVLFFPGSSDGVLWLEGWRKDGPDASPGRPGAEPQVCLLLASGLGWTLSRVPHVAAGEPGEAGAVHRRGWRC